MADPVITDLETIKLLGGGGGNEEQRVVCIFTSGAATIPFPKYPTRAFLRWATGISSAGGVGGWVGWSTTNPTVTGIYPGTFFFVGGSVGLTVAPLNIPIPANAQLYLVTNGVLTAGFGFFVSDTV